MKLSWKWNFNTGPMGHEWTLGYALNGSLTGGDMLARFGRVKQVSVTHWRASIQITNKEGESDHATLSAAQKWLEQEATAYWDEIQAERMAGEARVILKGME